MIAFFDFNGPTNFTDTFNDEDDDFTDLTVVAGEYAVLHCITFVSYTFRRRKITKEANRHERPVRVFVSWFKTINAHAASIRVLPL